MKEIIENNLKKYKITARNRITFHTRLKKYHDSYNNVFFLLNIVTILLVSLTLVIEITKVEMTLISLLSIYTIFTQYYIAQKNYSQRASAALTSYHSIIRLRNKLKHIKLDTPTSEKVLIIEERYNEILNAAENHYDLDDELRMKKDKSRRLKKRNIKLSCSSKLRYIKFDFTFDKIFIYINYAVILFGLIVLINILI